LDVSNLIAIKIIDKHTFCQKTKFFQG